MHDFNGIEIKKEDLLDSVKTMYKEKRRLVMINGYINENKENVIAYNFDVNGDITTYLVKGEEVLPSITPIYSASARWAEEEIEEMMNMKFEGLDRSGRLFLPEEFKDGEGQILVMPLSELKKYKDK
ncbi:NADH-quinone oxidoreductase subunit C [Clostridium paraputrificum]|uniref:NADH-quinone oxidoreductase subunit C n=1 Tax=Clostridium paraputrificum TaxID=29363 RepID=UPI00325BE678